MKVYEISWQWFNPPFWPILKKHSFRRDNYEIILSDLGPNQIPKRPFKKYEIHARATGFLHAKASKKSLTSRYIIFERPLTKPEKKKVLPNNPFF